MKLTTMETWIFVFMVARVFVSGVEEFFILPTALFYMEFLGQSKSFLALLLGAFNISAMISAPIVGRFADAFGHFKFIIIICFLTQIAGSLIYAIPISAIFPLVGRIISGIGNASAGVSYGLVALYTHEEYCAKVFIFFDGMFVLGATVGPLLSSFTLFNADILGWKINDGNSPGVLLAIIWCMMTTVAFFLPNNLGKENMSSKKNILCDENEDTPVRMLDSSIEASKSRTRYSSIFCVFYQEFSSVVYSMIATFYTPLLANHLFHLQFIHIKLLFLNSSLFSLVIFLSLYSVSEYFDERNLLVFLNFMQLPVFAILTYFAFSWNDVFNNIMNSYILIPFICLGMPYFQFSLCCSILAKITDKKNAAFYQGLSLAMFQLGVIAGRIVSGFIFSQTPLLFYCLGISSSWIIGTLWFYFEYCNLRHVHVKI